MSESQPQFDGDANTRDAIDDLQRQVAQKTGQVPRLPFITDKDGRLHELVEEEVRDLPTDKGEQQ